MPFTTGVIYSLNQLAAAAAPVAIDDAVSVVATRVLGNTAAPIYYQVSYRTKSLETDLPTYVQHGCACGEIVAETNTTTALSHMQPAVEQLTRHMSNATRLANAKLDVWREDVSM